MTPRKNLSTPRFIDNAGIKLAVYETGPKDGYPVLLVHGWPELAYSWTSQIAPLAAAGYRVFALDLRGFGRSSAPRGKLHYGISQMVSDLEAVLDDAGLAQTVLVGHDWGGPIVWGAAQRMSQRVSHVISICTPYNAPAPVNPLDILRGRFGESHYFIYFNEHPDEAEALFENNIAAFFTLMFQHVRDGAAPRQGMYALQKRVRRYLDKGAPDLGGLIMSDDDLQVYIDAFRHSGFHGGLSLYRNVGENWAEAKGLSPMIHHPALMISADKDFYLPPEVTDGMPALVPDLERHVIKDCGHWVMWEQPEALSGLMLDWLARRVG